MTTIKYTSAEKIKEAITNVYKSLEDIVNNLVSKTDFRVGSSSVDCNQATISWLFIPTLIKKRLLVGILWSCL